MVAGIPLIYSYTPFSEKKESSAGSTIRSSMELTVSSRLYDTKRLHEKTQKWKFGYFNLIHSGIAYWAWRATYPDENRIIWIQNLIYLEGIEFSMYNWWQSVMSRYRSIYPVHNFFIVPEITSFTFRFLKIRREKLLHQVANINRQWQACLLVVNCQM